MKDGALPKDVKKSAMNNYKRSLALCILVGIGIGAVLIVAIDITAQPHIQTVDHSEILKLQKQILEENQTINNIVAFMQDRQIPFDNNIVKWANGTEARLAHLENHNATK